MHDRARYARGCVAFELATGRDLASEILRRAFDDDLLGLSLDFRALVFLRQFVVIRMRAVARCHDQATDARVAVRKL